MGNGAVSADSQLDVNNVLFLSMLRRWMVSKIRNEYCLAYFEVACLGIVIRTNYGLGNKLDICSLQWNHSHKNVEFSC